MSQFDLLKAVLDKLIEARAKGEKPTVEDLRQLEDILKAASPETLEEMMKLPGIQGYLTSGWSPNPGQQKLALDSEADELFYGGTAGGGKTDLLYGAAYTQHKRALLLRRTNKEASRFIRRFSEIVGHTNGWSGQQSTFTLPDGQVIEWDLMTVPRVIAGPAIMESPDTTIVAPVGSSLELDEDYNGFIRID